MYIAFIEPVVMDFGASVIQFIGFVYHFLNRESFLPLYMNACTNYYQMHLMRCFWKLFPSFLRELFHIQEGMSREGIIGGVSFRFSPFYTNISPRLKFTLTKESILHYSQKRDPRISINETNLVSVFRHV